MGSKLRKRINKGDLFFADLGITRGSEQNGVRPVLVVQNNKGNQCSPTVIISPVTSKMKKEGLPTHVALGRRFGLSENSMALLEQVRAIDRFQLRGYIGTIDAETIKRVDAAIMASFGLENGRADI